MGNEFLEAYDNYYDSIYRYTYIKVGNKWDAEDITSEVFRKAFVHFKSIKSNTKAWLFSTARNSINDFYRRKRTMYVELEDHVCSAEYQLEENLIKTDELNCLKKSLEALQAEEIDLISMRYFADLKYEEISSVLGMKCDYLRVKVSRTIKKLGYLLVRCLEG